MNKIEILKSQRSRHLSDAQLLLMAGLTSSELKTKYQDLISSADAAEDEIRMHERLNELDPQPEQRIAPKIEIKVDPVERRAKLNEAFRNYLRTEKYPEEYRDIFAASTGGALIPENMFPVLGEVAKYYAPLLDYLTVELNTNGRAVRFATENDSTNFLTVASEGSAPTETDQTFSSTLLNADLLRGVVTLSLQLLDDSNFDLAQVITRAAGKRLGRSLEAILTTAADPASNAAPNNQGLVNAATVGQTTATLAGGIGEGDVSSLVESLDPTWWSKAVFMMSGGTYLYLLKQQTSIGARYWPELGNMKLWNWDVVINNSLAQTLTANSVPIIFGDMSTYAVSHTGLSVKVLTERYLDQLKQGFQISSRISSQLLSPGGNQGSQTGGILMQEELNNLESARNQLVDKIASSPVIINVDNLMPLLDAVDDFRSAFDVGNDDIDN